MNPAIALSVFCECYRAADRAAAIVNRVVPV